MSEGRKPMDDDEESATPTGTNTTWDRLKRLGLPLTAEEYLKHDYGKVPDYLSEEELQQVPREVREQARTLTSRSPAEKAKGYLTKLAATKPKRNDFKSQEQYEEALGYWQTHQRRILGLSVRATPPKGSETQTSAAQVGSLPEDRNLEGDDVPVLQRRQPTSTRTSRSRAAKTVSDLQNRGSPTNAHYRGAAKRR